MSLVALWLVDRATPAQVEPIQLHLEPARIAAASGPFPYSLSLGTLGTEIVTLKVRNQGTTTVEFPTNRWLVIETASEEPVFTPIAPFSPLTLAAGEEVAIAWRLRESADVHFAGGAAVGKIPRVYAGEYRAIVYFRLPGETAWRQFALSIRVERDELSIGWVVAVAVLVMVGLVAWWVFD